MAVQPSLRCKQSLRRKNPSVQQLTLFPSSSAHTHPQRWDRWAITRHLHTHTFPIKGVMLIQSDASMNRVPHRPASRAQTSGYLIALGAVLCFSYFE